MSESEPVFRLAQRADLDEIVQLLVDDPRGRERENAGPPLPEAYVRAFETIAADPNNELLVATRDGQVIGTLQWTLLPCISHQGSPRALIESVRVLASERGRGIGQRFMRWTLERARERGCRLAQLTTNRSREEALRFYLRLGFEASHHGLKLDLEA